ncbi:MAG: response regulator transcription factor [Pseudomonadales bacterium]|nr:response regulator transcription factor [Pseudomonadales bacterium]MBO6563460.1 response regulator transcription factor [Pseudomonadales bacterium]MBO6596554.1 response regulator transcription factor [Pseudomonadales bacterium]MBO6656444.1 response regulator transcription factor [Pseudomonadales bacterium]MBO6703249.1 response regulator transcription factor [Pseudomonadales bacterium]
MKVFVVDDERLARDRLVRMVETLDDYVVVGTAESGEEAVREAIKLEPDVVLLDIRMPGMDGLEAGKQLSTLASPPAVIFCTAFGEHAIEAFDVSASGYLMKPVRREALQDALGKASKVNRVQMEAIMGRDETLQERSRTHISAKTRRGIELIPLSEVKFFQADHKYVTVRHEGGEVLIDDTLRDLENEFGDKVVRIHRNALVMMDHLEGLERDPSGHYQVRMRGIDERLDVSRRHVSGLRRLVQTL